MATATEAQTTTGFKAPCIRCGCEASVSVILADLSFSCSSCSEDFTADDVRAFIADWRRILTWIDSATSIGAEP